MAKTIFRSLCCLMLASLLLLPSLLSAQSQTNEGVEDNTGTPRASVDWTVLTNSPADTLESFNRLAALLERVVFDYEEDKSRENYARSGLIAQQIGSLYDLSEVAEIAQQDARAITTTSLLDIFGRIGFPDPALAPGPDELASLGGNPYSIPNTPFRIAQQSEGERAGEWLLEARTVEAAPHFLRGIATFPVDPDHRIQDWTTLLRQLTGPMVPQSLVDLIPRPLKVAVLGTPIWKIMATALVLAVLGTAITLWLRLLPETKEHETTSKGFLFKSLAYLAVNALLYGTVTVIDRQLVLTGTLAYAFGSLASVIYWAFFALAFWWLVLAIAEWIMERNQIKEGTINANMVQLSARVLGLVGVVVILAFGAQTIGIPVLTLLAGLGVGGVAVALAARPTLENLIGGIILFIDKPILVGEYGTFGDKSGTVEKIGARTVTIRVLDRTTIEIPNARFVDMEIINWSRADRLWINHTLELRYDTTNEQIQYIIAKCREIFHAHPEVDGKTGRALFLGYSDCALKISVQAYVDTPYWTVYFAVREDILLRIKKVIEECGTYFAVPTRTVFHQRDPGVDPERAEQTAKELDGWREAGEFPFPKHSDAMVTAFQGQIEYPVPGSPDYVRAVNEQKDKDDTK